VRAGEGDPAGADSPRRGRLRRIWRTAPAAFLLFPLISWLAQKDDALPLVPDTPIARVNADWSDRFRFLRRASPLVPSGGRYTARAADPGGEMVLYMMSIGLVPQGTPLPSSYHGDFRPEGSRAQYVLSFGCVPAGPPPAALLRPITGGCVLRRSQPPQMPR
jgi:hypothetical protein